MRLLNKRVFQIKNRQLMGLVFVLLLLLRIDGTVFAQSTTGISRHGAAFLGVSSHARQVAMGEAFSGLANDISVLKYNVGGLGRLPNAMIGLDYHNWIEDTQQGAISGILPTRFGNFGFDFHYFNEGSISEIDRNFVPTGQKVESNDISLTVGYGRGFNVIGKDLSVGGGVRVIRQSLADYIATAVGVDFGAVFRTKYVSFGAAIQNLGVSKLEFISQKETLPETYRGGLAVTIPNFKPLEFNLTTDISYITGQDLRYYSGGEMIIGEIFAIRGGYRFQDWEPYQWSAGFGLLIPMEWLAGSETHLDYAYAPLNDFDASAHRFSLVFSFGALRTRDQAHLYDEKRLVRLIYEEQKLDRMNERMKQELDAAEKARKAAEQAQKAAEDAERRTRELEEELKRRLEQIQEIAKTSKGKIEVEPLSKEKIQVRMRINFDFDSAEIREKERGTMSKVAQILNTYPESQVHISGHTDYIGTEEYNIRLSERRIRSVISYLTRKETVEFERFFMPVGYGEMQPIASNATEEGRFLNRRVDFIIYTQDGRPEMPEGSAIQDVVAVDDSTVHIICNGTVTFSHHYLDESPRIVIDLPNIFLLFDKQSFEFNRGPLVRARAAFHADERYSRIVIDLIQDLNYRIELIDNFIKVQIRK